MAEQFPDANVGVLCGLSGLTVIDVDGDAALANEARKRFGKSPLEVETPSGGRHLYFRNSGERCANLRREGLAIDIKAAGGLIVAPPSRKLSTGAAYQFVQGSWDKLARLPTIRNAALDRRSVDDIPAGIRNDTLFRIALREARHCDDFGALLDVMHWRNQCIARPVEKGEMEKIARHAWAYQEAGTNWVAGEANAMIGRKQFSQVMTIPNGSDAIALLLKLKMEHGARTERGRSFALSPKAMANAEVMPGWGRKRYERTRDALIECGAIEIHHRGGLCPGDAWLFKLN